MIPDNTRYEFKGGDRGGEYNSWANYNFQIDYNGFNGRWEIEDSGKPVILWESLSVLGPQPHILASQLKHTPVFTCLRQLDGFGPFKYLAYPYDHKNIVRFDQHTPYNRINEAQYTFGRKFGVGDTCGNLFGKASYENQYLLRYRLEALKGINTQPIGPNLSDKLNWLRQFRYGVAAENCCVEGYITEKLWDCLWVGVVPIYFGGVLPDWLEKAVIRITPDQAGINRVLAYDEDTYMKVWEAGQMALSNAALQGYSWKYAHSVLKEYL